MMVREERWDEEREREEFCRRDGIAEEEGEGKIGVGGGVGGGKRACSTLKLHNYQFISYSD